MKTLIFFYKLFRLPDWAVVENALWTYRKDHRVLWAVRLAVLVTAGCSVALALQLALWVVFVVPSLVIGWLLVRIYGDSRPTPWWLQVLQAACVGTVATWALSLSVGLFDGLLFMVAAIAVLSFCQGSSHTKPNESK